MVHGQIVRSVQGLYAKGVPGGKCKMIIIEVCKNSHKIGGQRKRHRSPKFTEVSQIETKGRRCSRLG